MAAVTMGIYHVSGSGDEVVAVLMTAAAILGIAVGTELCKNGDDDGANCDDGDNGSDYH